MHKLHDMELLCKQKLHLKTGTDLHQITRQVAQWAKLKRSSKTARNYRCSEYGN